MLESKNYTHWSSITGSLQAGRCHTRALWYGGDHSYHACALQLAHCATWGEYMPKHPGIPLTKTLENQKTETETKTNMCVKNYRMMKIK